MSTQWEQSAPLRNNGEPLPWDSWALSHVSVRSGDCLPRLYLPWSVSCGQGLWCIGLCLRLFGRGCLCREKRRSEKCSERQGSSWFLCIFSKPGHSELLLWLLMNNGSTLIFYEQSYHWQWHAESTCWTWSGVQAWSWYMFIFVEHLLCAHHSYRRGHESNNCNHAIYGEFLRAGIVLNAALSN